MKEVRRVIACLEAAHDKAAQDVAVLFAEIPQLFRVELEGKVAQEQQGLGRVRSNLRVSDERSGVVDETSMGKGAMCSDYAPPRRVRARLLFTQMCVSADS